MVNLDEPVRVLSLFDGMSCGMLALQKAGVPCEQYVAYETDPYAIKTSAHNFPMIEHRGDVFEADFTEFANCFFAIGGSPCTFWSIAQKHGRETEASGMGWELFCQFVRAINEAKPMFFIYENNKSMSKAIRASIDRAFGFEAVCINSALLSAQSRQRLYWVGKRNPDGTYSPVPVELPQDAGVLLRDVLDVAGWKSLSNREMLYMVRNSKGNYSDRWTFLQTPGISDKAKCITANVSKGVPYNICAEPVRVGTWPNQAKNQSHDSQQYRIYDVNGKSVTLCGNGGGMGAKTGLYAVPVDTIYATPCEWDSDGTPVRAVIDMDGTTHPIYRVMDGYMTINGAAYPIKLPDGFYVVRKLSVPECKRLQTVPEWYEFPVSDTRALKMLGNGWTVDIIAFLITACMNSIAE